MCVIPENRSICLYAESPRARPDACHLPAYRVDVNTDRRISAKEMQHWNMEKTAEHFQEAVKENKLHFRAVDPDGDGTVSPIGRTG